MDEIDCCWLCWKSVVKEEVESENNGGPELDISRSRTYLDVCIKYLKLESENLDEVTEELNNCPLCLNCIEAAKKLTEIVDNLESLKRELDEYCSSFLDRLKNRRECVRLENMKPVKNVRRSRKKDTRNDDYLPLKEELISEGNNEVGGKLHFDTDGSDLEGIDLQEFGRCNDNEKDSAKPGQELNLDKGRGFIHKVKARPGRSTNRNVITRKLKGKKFPKKVNCSKCNETFGTKSSLAEHYRINHKRRKCEECGIDFPRRRLLVCHVLKVHQTERPYKCSTCPKSFKWKSCFTRHERRHTSERSYAEEHHSRKRMRPIPRSGPYREYHCDRCGMIIKSSKAAFEDHKRLHTGEKPFKCEDCEECFRTKLNLQVHKTNVHLNEFPFECNQCEMKFKRRPQLIQHRSTAHPNPDDLIICEDCGRSFKRKGDYDLHRRVVHEKIKLKCEQCDKMFATISHLRFHIKLVHTKEVQFVCHICGKESDCNRKLQDHIRTHTGEKPFQCPECGKHCTSKTALCYHRVHAANHRLKKI